MSRTEKNCDSLEADRAAFASSIAALRARLFPGQRAGRADEDDTAEETSSGFAAADGNAALKAAMPALKAAGATIRANPLAAALAGAGLGWLAFSGISRARSKPREARPEWLVEVDQRRDEAERLRQKINRAAEEGLLDEAEADESLAEVETSLQSEIRRLMGRGLDGLESETRAAALAARQAALTRATSGKGFGRKVVRTLGAGGGLAALAALVAAMTRRDPAAPGPDEDDAAAAREALAQEAARLSALAAELSAAVRGVLSQALEIGKEQREDPDQNAVPPRGDTGPASGNEG
ncbi:hypothetical protein HOY34_01800 [Xinfangfangia sp. D13-10-4-6]|uniref:hypothetical protein n=1 Tax=Pseudogemmobacter hezensis TaxID=2737662 RepID=UPI001556809F|nr:hypothetical protein [Pseudogemmobacter hezensis]NPD13932.1 hypothetical protein [Pseudogemmobacter hezensis]